MFGSVFGLPVRNRLSFRDAIAWIVGCMSILGLGAGYSPTMSYPQAKPETAGGLQSSSLESFDKLWEERTISFGQGSDRTGFPSFSGSSVGDRSERGAFPLILHATFMDSVLVEAGSQEYSRLASMTEGELKSYRESFLSAHDISRYIYIWIELQTPLSEEYLKLDRWTIFLEDEQKHQFDPIRVVEHPRERGVARRQPTSEDETGNLLSERLQERFLVAKDVEFYFPKYHIQGEPVVGSEMRRLKLVVVQSSNPNVRAEGTWDLSNIRKH